MYKLVAPLVMNATVLRQNDNYPYKTSSRHEWLVALADDDTKVWGFFPVERREGYAYINNYYISPNADESLLSKLIERSVELYVPVCPLVAVVHTRDAETFLEKGFVPEREWKHYVKMKYQGSDGKTS